MWWSLGIKEVCEAQVFVVLVALPGLLQLCVEHLLRDVPRRLPAVLCRPLPRKRTQDVDLVRLRAQTQTHTHKTDTHRREGLQVGVPEQ